MRGNDKNPRRRQHRELDDFLLSSDRPKGTDFSDASRLYRKSTGRRHTWFYASGAGKISSPLIVPES
jgi:hypothetical protein